MAEQVLTPTVITDAGSGGTLSWSIPGTAGIATVAFSGDEATSNWLFLSGFGASVPTDATNRSMILSVERKASVALRAQDDPAILLGGTVQNDALGSGGFFPIAYATYNHFSYDLSGYTPAQINSAGFGVALRIEFHNDFNTTDVTAFINAMSITLSFVSLSSVSWDAIHYRSPNRRLYHRSPNRKLRT